MNVNRVRFIAACLFSLLTIMSGGPAGAIPNHLLISGQLLDQYGNPVHYTSMTPDGPVEISVPLAARIMLYDSVTTSQPFALIPTTATAYNAYFNISFSLPDSAITRDSLWYSLSLDVANDGLSSNDFFPERFEIGSVPFALSVKPVTYFTTFGGHSHSGRTFRPGGVMMMAPFETPPGGIEFNQMNTYMIAANQNASFSFGVYDESGRLVVSSGLITVKVPRIEYSFLQVKHARIKLQPSKQYYIGLSCTANDSAVADFPWGNKPVAPILGWVPLTTSTGQIPSSFDPSTIDPDCDIIALPVTFCLVEEAAMAKTGWSTAKPGEPQYRWIPSKSSKNK